MVDAGCDAGRRPGPHPRRGPRRPGSRSRRPASRSPRCSAPAPRGRVHQRRHRGDRRRRAGARPSGARTRWCPPSSTRRCALGAERARRGHRRRRRRRRAGSTPTSCSPPIRPDTALVHVQWGNHEVGTVQPVAEVVAACRERGVLVHVDAAQAAGTSPIAFDDARRRPAVGAAPTSSAARRASARCSCAAGLRLRPLLRRRRPGAGPPGRARERAGHRRLRRRRRRARRRRRSTPRPTDAARGSPTACSPASPTLDGVARLRRPRPTGSPTSCASASTASSRRRCCSASTGPASPPTRAARARPSRSSRRRCSRPWASTPTAQPAGLGRLVDTDADIDAVLAALPPVARAARLLAPEWPDGTSHSLVNLYLVRHADAGDRQDWDRPTGASPVEEGPAAGGRPWRGARRRVRSHADALEPCRALPQTARPVAATPRADVEQPAPRRRGAFARQGGCSTTGGRGRDTVICSHGDLIPEVLHDLESEGTPVEGAACAKGSIWHLVAENGRLRRRGRSTRPPGSRADTGRLMTVPHRRDAARGGAGASCGDDEPVACVLEPSPPAVDESSRSPTTRRCPTDRPVGARRRPPAPDAGTTLATRAPGAARRCADHWLGTWRSLPPLPARLRALAMRVCTCLAVLRARPARRSHRQDRSALDVPGGSAPRSSATTCRCGSRTARRRADGERRAVRRAQHRALDAAALVGVDPEPATGASSPPEPPGDHDAPLDVDPLAVAFLDDWFGFGAARARAAARSSAADDDPSLGCSCGRSTSTSAVELGRGRGTRPTAPRPATPSTPSRTCTSDPGDRSTAASRSGTTSAFNGASLPLSRCSAPADQRGRALAYLRREPSVARRQVPAPACNAAR